MRLLEKSALVLAAAVALPLAAAPAMASASTIAAWEMNESARYGGVMHDSTSNNINGNIGDKVQRHEVRGDRVGYRFFVDGSKGAGQDRLVTVADRDALDPGKRTYVVEVGIRTGASNQNIIQKGQANTTGGFFKVDMTKGIVYCVFKGSTGKRSIGSGIRLDDAARHLIKCKRQGQEVSITVDGKTPRRISGPTGNISNGDPLTIGGKKYCNGDTVGCDYFVGVLDRIVLRAG